ncbi:MAG TPA: hypothetical protein VK815_09895 [Candidatus Acidoferrales bacterium]|jgi:hypothetical protein|nr:hypothetical protein [Candidatus Acidoferrales bacterium]
MKDLNIQIDGNQAEWEQECWQNAQNQNLFDLVNFTREMIPVCHAMAKKYGYELKANIPPTEPGVCHFIPRNYDLSNITTPDVFSVSP